MKIGEYIRQFLYENVKIEPKTPIVNIDDIYLQDAHMFFPKTNDFSAGKKLVFTTPRVIIDKKGRSNLKGIQYILGKVIGRTNDGKIEFEVLRAEGDTVLKKDDIMYLGRQLIEKSKNVVEIRGPKICPTCNGSNLVNDKFDGFCSSGCKEVNWNSIKKA